MSELIKKAVRKNYSFWICLVVSIVLLVGGAITPPPFEIDQSLFIAVGELFGFATLGCLSSAIDRGIDAKITHGNTSLTVGDLNKDKHHCEEQYEEHCEEGL